MCQLRLPLCSDYPAYCNNALFVNHHPSTVAAFWLQFLRNLFTVPLVFFKPADTIRGPRPGYRRRRSACLCGCCVQDSFVGPGMHSLAVKSTAWLWLIVLSWVSIQPVCRIRRGKKTKKKNPPCPDQVTQTHKQLWHASSTCSSETGQVMTSRETWLSQVFISHGRWSRRVTPWRIMTAGTQWTETYWYVIQTTLDNCPGSTVQK